MEQLWTRVTQVALVVWPAAVGAAIGLLVHWAAYALAARLARRTRSVADDGLIQRTRAPARLLAALLGLQMMLPGLPASEASLLIARHALSVALIGCVTWMAMRAIRVIDDVVAARYPVDVADNLSARRARTQTRLLVRTAMALTATVGLAAMLMTFPRVQQLGASLLASAGIAGVILGLAAKPTVVNLLAGLQIALTDPIRLDDVVIVEGEWGRIEEIGATYVVVRIWDERRLIVPLQHFLDHPFQNWTRSGSELLGTVFLWVDYAVPVDAARAELTRFVGADPRWDGRVCGLQVTDSSERAVQLRALVSARDASALWDLRCAVREHLIAWLQQEHPEGLPRLRTELERAPAV